MLSRSIINLFNYNEVLTIMDFRTPLAVSYNFFHRPANIVVCLNVTSNVKTIF